MNEEIIRTPIPNKKSKASFCAENDFLSIQFKQSSPIGTIVYYVLFFVPIPFLIYLIDRWIDQKMMLWMCYKPVRFFEDADTIVIIDQGENVNILPLSFEKLGVGAGEAQLECFTFTFLNVRYIYERETERIININDMFCRTTITDAFAKFRYGRYENEIDSLITTYGENKIEVTKPSIVDLLVNDILSFMGVFEMLCLLIVIIDGSTLYMVFVIFLIVIAKTMMILDGFHQYNQIRKYIMHADGIITIRKNEDDCFSKLTISNHELVPGDIIELTSNLKMPVDALIISGSCMLDEKDISGDSIPKIKFAVDDNLLLPLSSLPENNTARAGSVCVFTRTAINDSVLAIVVRTGYNTEKGKMLRTVLMPKIVKFRFFHEAVVFVYIMAVVSLIGSVIYLVYQVYFLTDIQFTPMKILMNMLSLFFSTVKPVLPFSLYIGLEASKDKLSFKHIMCSNKYKINDCGRADTLFFDKTGTVTKDDSVFNGIYLNLGKASDQKPEMSNLLKLSAINDDVKNEREGEERALKVGPKAGTGAQLEFQSQIFKSKIEQKSKHNQNAFKLDMERGNYFSAKIESYDGLISHGEQIRNYLLCLSFCNSLIKSGSKVVGNNIDTEMFKFSPYNLSNYMVPETKLIKKRYTLDPAKTLTVTLPSVVTVEKIFDYSNEFKTEGVIVKDGDGKYYLVSKGAPESIVALCDWRTVSVDFEIMLYDICATGIRVIGLAIKELPDDAINLTRSEIETGMTFVGLFALDNPLKDEAPGVIKTLVRNLITCVLITGDNIFTAISVGVKSNFIPPNKTLYLGDLTEDAETKKKKIHWVPFDYSELLPKKVKDIAAQDDVDSEILVSKSRVEVKPLPNVIKRIDELLNINSSQCVMALTGNAYDFMIEKYQKNLTPKNKSLFGLVHRICMVYGRCDAYQKSRIVKNHKLFSKRNYPIGYIGDGANDTEAMKHADISLLINHQEISFVSSFSCHDGDLQKVIELIKEGKNNVEGGYQNFKFFIFLICGQFVATFLLYLNYIGFNTHQTMFIDIAVFMVLCSMSDTFWHKPDLNRSKPKSSILVFNILFPLICHLALLTVLLAVSYSKLKTLSFYKPPHKILSDQDKEDFNIDLDTYKFYDNHFLFCMMNLFFVTYFVFSNYQSTFRVQLYKNTKVVIYIVFFAAFMIYLCNLSEKTNPNFIDNFIIDVFGVLKTYRTNRIYIAVTVCYWVCALFVEKLSDTIYHFREENKFTRIEEQFIQNADDSKSQSSDEAVEK
jgi:cation-transporting ATPase 13A2